MSSDTPENGPTTKSEEADRAATPLEADAKTIDPAPASSHTQSLIEPTKLDQDHTAADGETEAPARGSAALSGNGGRAQAIPSLVWLGVALAAILQGILFYAFLPSARLVIAALIGAGTGALLYRVCFAGRARAWAIAGVLGGITLVVNLILGIASPNLGAHLAQQVAALGGARNPSSPVADTGRLSSIIQRQVVAIDVEHGPPAADIRDFPAPGPVGYHASFANARNDLLKVVLFAGDQIVAQCKPYVMNGAGDYSCQTQTVDPGEYRFDVTINNVSVATLRFGVGQSTRVRPWDAAPPRPAENPKDEEKPAPPPAASAYISQPPWRRMPNADDLARVMPERASEAGVSGRVILNCTIVGGGRVACAVEEENPRGYGFGEAALRASRDFRMATELTDGRSTDGLRVRIPIRFSP